MNDIDNPLSEYQSPSKEALRNFGIDISKEAVEKYALKKFGRLPQSHVETNFAICSKITEETRRFMKNDVFNCDYSSCGTYDIYMHCRNSVFA